MLGFSKYILDDSLGLVIAFFGEKRDE